MKQRLFILSIFFLLFLNTGAALASPAVTVVIDGQVQKYDQPPVIINGRTLVPLRGVFETLGAEVKWIEQTQTVTATKGDTIIVLKIGSDEIILNGKTQTLDPAPQVLNGRTMVPLRFAANALGAEVKWDDATKTAIIYTQDNNKRAKNDKQFKEEIEKEVIFTWNRGHGWVKTSGTGSSMEDDTVNSRAGLQSMKLKATSAECVADKTQLANLLGKNLHLELYVHDITRLKEIHLLMDTTMDWTSYFGYTIYSYALKNGWNSVSLIPSAFYRLGTVPPAYSRLAEIKRWRIKVVGLEGQEATVSFDRLLAVAQPQRGKVTITFDDGYETTYTEAKRRMDKFGFSGVAYIITDLTGTPGRMTLDQLKELQEAGWDISSHTKTHKLLVSGRPTADDIKDELSGSKQWLIQNGFFRGAQHYSSPGGQFNEDMLNEIKKYYQTHRTIIEEKECHPPADPYLLKARNVINTTPLAKVQQWIDEAAASKEWLILVFHKIAEPADTETIVSPATFQAIIDYLATKDLEVATMSDMAAR